MGTYVAIALLIVIFILGLFLKKARNGPILPIISAALGVFFLVSALQDIRHGGIPMLFAILGFGYAVYYLRLYRRIQGRKNAGADGR